MFLDSSPSSYINPIQQGSTSIMWDPWCKLNPSNSFKDSIISNFNHFLDIVTLFSRLIDSAQAYNEEHVGFALEKSGIPREDIFIVSKVHPRFLGYQETIQSVEDSLKNLKVKSFY